MKVQDVMLQAMAKKITWWQAVEIPGISDRYTWRWRERYVVLKQRHRKELRGQLGNPERDDLTVRLWIEMMEQDRKNSETYFMIREKSAVDPHTLTDAARELEHPHERWSRLGFSGTGVQVLRYFEGERRGAFTGNCPTLPASTRPAPGTPE